MKIRDLLTFWRKPATLSIVESDDAAKEVAKEAAKRRRLPTTQALRDIPIASIPEWNDVGKVKAALGKFEVGQFDQASLMAEAMGRDDRLTGLMAQRVKSLLGVPLSFGSAEGDEDENEDPADVEWFEERWSKIFPDAALAKFCDWAHLLGLGVGELVWTTKEGEWLPEFRVWHPRYVYWRWDTRSYWISTMDGTVEITPGDGHWVLYAPHGLQRGWMGGLIRSLAIPWLIRQFTYRDWARYSEVHGIPTRVGIVPPGAQNDEKKRFIKELANLSVESVILAPQLADKTGFDLKLVEAMADGWKAFDGLIGRAEDSLAIAILGQTLTSGAKSGGLGTGGVALVHEKVRDDLLRFDAKTLAACLHDQVLKPVAEMNLGDPEKAPCPHWEIDPPEDRTESASTLNMLGQAIGSLKAGGMAVDVDALAEQYEIPLLSPADRAKQEAEDTQRMVDRAQAMAAVAPEDPQAKPGGSKGTPPPKKLSASPGVQSKPPGFIRGQIYTDDLTDKTIEQAKELLAPDLAAVLSIVQHSGSYEEMRVKLKAAFLGASPARIADLTHKALVLAELNGHDAVKEDNG